VTQKYLSVEHASCTVHGDVLNLKFIALLTQASIQGVSGRISHNSGECFLS